LLGCKEPHDFPPCPWTPAPYLSGECATALNPKINVLATAYTNFLDCFGVTASTINANHVPAFFVT
ncbi:MAG TPA: hypothetical protein VJQ45_12850, partial [Ktedonobacterales bacterium]|nr:hypothetical protein [Ktedonobacterales bacterium]